MEWQKGHGLGLRQPRHQVTRPRLLLTPDTTFSVNKKLNLPTQYITRYDQGLEGACGGFGFSWAMSIVNRKFFDAFWLYRQAQLVDEWEDTPPEQGTSETAVAKILIEKGHRQIWAGISWPAKLSAGISAVRYAQSVDELRGCILQDTPFCPAIPWYENFDSPVWSKERGWVIGEGPLGRLRGYHLLCGYGARDQFDAFDLVNNWGRDYPLVKIPYSTVDTLMQQGGTFAVITDR